MRISDWSSDVCSSDLSKGADPQARRPAFAVVRARPGLAASTGERPALSFCRPHPLRRHGVDLKWGNVLMSVILFSAAAAAAAASAGMEPVITVTAGRGPELGRSSGGERVCQYV